MVHQRRFFGTTHIMFHYSCRPTLTKTSSVIFQLSRLILSPNLWYISNLKKIYTKSKSSSFILRTQCKTRPCLVEHNLDMLTGIEERNAKIFFNTSEVSLSCSLLVFL